MTRKSIESDMMALPNNIDIKDKYYVGYFKNEKLIAVLDLIDGYPKKDIVFIGFLMIDISIQKNGVGSAIVNELIDYLTTLKYKEVRLGWINGNLQAEHFWIKNGFCSIIPNHSGNASNMALVIFFFSSSSTTLIIFIFILPLLIVQ